MPKQAQLEQPPDYIEEAVKEILGRCLIGTLSFRLKHGYGIEGPPRSEEHTSNSSHIMLSRMPSSA